MDFLIALVLLIIGAVFMLTGLICLLLLALGFIIPVTIKAALIMVGFGIFPLGAAIGYVTFTVNKHIPKEHRKKEIIECE